MLQFQKKLNSKLIESYNKNNKLKKTSYKSEKTYKP